jgi:hypothetical protein
MPYRTLELVPHSPRGGEAVQYSPESSSNRRRYERVYYRRLQTKSKTFQSNNESVCLDNTKSHDFDDWPQVPIMDLRHHECRNQKDVPGTGLLIRYPCHLGIGLNCYHPESRPIIQNVGHALGDKSSIIHLITMSPSSSYLPNIISL